MSSARQENARTLASLIGMGEDEAAERLECTVLLTAAVDKSNQDWAREITALLERTVSVTDDPGSPCRAELVVGPTAPRSSASCVYAAIDADQAVIDLQPVSVSRTEPHPLFAAVCASAAVAGILFTAIDADGLPAVKFPLRVRFDQLGVSAEELKAEILLDGAVLIGAGAVGHAFLRALRHVNARGALPIIDPKTVGGGNPNRCLYLTAADVGSAKAAALARHAQKDFPNLRLWPFTEDFHSYVGREQPQPTAIVGVDSRHVRRSIQAELPGRVLDASTTDVRAVVIHSHRQPTQDACLACIYRHVPDENAREQAIADALGIDLSMVKEYQISAAAAAKIAAHYPDRDLSRIKGIAYDSLFRELCGEKALKTPEGRQVLAPFAFVSSLAGALLVIEMLRTQKGQPGTNYWQVNPWGKPMGRLRSLRPRVPDCECCSKPHFLAIADQLWGTPGPDAAPPQPDVASEGR